APAAPSAGAPAKSPGSAAAPSGPAATHPAAAGPGQPEGHVASTSTRQQAAAILHDNDAYYQTEFNAGVAALDGGSQAGATAFHAWSLLAAADAKPGQDAFKQADTLFAGSTVPPSLNSWQSANGSMSADVAKLASDGQGVGGPNDAQARQHVQADVQQMAKDAAAAEQDATNVSAGS
ncbi:hypothetical protein ACQRUO_34365, partial [Kitasatospora sp. LaBMicrA B282]